MSTPVELLLAKVPSAPSIIDGQLGSPVMTSHSASADRDLAIQKELLERTRRIALIRRTLETLHGGPDPFFEIRALKTPNGHWKPCTKSGYFNNLNLASNEAFRCDERDRPAGLYVTLNRPDPTLLARAPNQLVTNPPNTTADQEITRRWWFFVDCDPVRPPGVSATESEQRAALELAHDVEFWLSSMGWPLPITGSSGNGYALFYRVDLENTDESTTLVRDALYGLAANVLSDHAKIDLAVFNAARIVRLFGTKNRKGFHTDERPYRISELYESPEPILLVDRDKLEAVARLAPRHGGLVTSQPVGPIDDRQQIVDRCRTYVAKMPEAIDGQQGSNAALAVACTAFRFGLTDTEARQVFDEYNLRCDPPWNDREIVHKLTDAREKVTSAGELGNMFLDDVPAVGQGHVSAEPLPRLTPGTRVRALDMGNIGVIVDDLGLGKGYRVHFVSPQGIHAEKVLADGLVESLDATASAASTVPTAPLVIRSAGNLVTTFPDLRQPVIHGLLRRGEIMNTIAASKIGKSWGMYHLAMCIATGQPWLGFATEPGEVLIVDNELHPETLAARLPIVAKSLGILPAEYEDRLHVVNLRGGLVDMLTFSQMTRDIAAGRFQLIVIDALYRMIPEGWSENDNAQMALLYNELDRIGDRLQSAIDCVHHASKGAQGDRSLTDTGSGAGAISRAADTHLILREHVEPECVVLEAACRSWAPIAPRCLRWRFPLWIPADDLDPTNLRRASKNRGGRPKNSENSKRDEPQPPRMTFRQFAANFASAKPMTKNAILAAAVDGGVSQKQAVRYFELALGAELLIESGKAGRSKLYALAGNKGLKLEFPPVGPKQGNSNE